MLGVGERIKGFVSYLRSVCLLAALTREVSLSQPGFPLKSECPRTHKVALGIHEYG